MKNMRYAVMRRVFPYTIPDRRQRVVEALRVKLKPGKSEVIAVPERRKGEVAGIESGEKFVIAQIC
jgi:hypothetical protein